MMKVKLFYAIIIFAIIFTGCSSDEEYSGNMTGESIKIEQRNYKPGLDLFLLIDESGSMTGPRGTDPTGIRFDASKYLLQNLFVKISDKEFPNRVAIIHFSDQITSSPLADVLTGNLISLQQAIQSTANPSGNTNIIEALKAVKTIYDNSTQYKNRRDRAVVIFTDGKPERVSNESMGETERQFSEIEKYIKDELKDYKVYVIGLDNQDASVKFSQTVKNWEKIIPSENIVAISEINDLYSKFNYTIEQMLQMKSSYENLVKDQGEFFVNPYVDNIEFHIFTRNRLRLSIYDPKNNPIRIDTTFVNVNQEGYIIHKVDNPIPGRWSYRLERGPNDRQPIRIVKNEIPFRLELLTPEPIFNSLGQRFFPLGKNVRLKAKFTKENGEEVEELPDYPLSFDARITSGDNPSFDKQLRFLPQNKAGINYYADEYISFDKEGKYNIRLNVKGGTTVEFSQTEPIEIIKIPYFELQETLPLTKLIPGSEIRIEIVFKNGNDKIDPSKYFVDNPNSIVLTQVIKTPDSSYKSVALWMEQSEGDSSTFYVLFPSEKDSFRTNEEGLYEFALDFKVKPLIEYRLFPSRVISTYDIFVEKTLLFIILDWFIGIIWLFVGLIVLGGLYKLYKYFVKGVKYSSNERSLIAVSQIMTEDSGDNDETGTTSKEISEEYIIIGENKIINKFSKPVLVFLGKSKKGKKLFVKLWARPLDKAGKKIEIYSGNFLSNLLFWKKSVAVITESQETKTIRSHSKTIELITKGEVSDVDYDTSGEIDKTGLDNSSEDSKDDFSLLK